MKVFQINTTVNSGSTGRAAEEIGRLLIENGHRSYIAYGRGAGRSISQLTKVGNRVGQAVHLLKSRLFDLHGFESAAATRKLVKKIELVDPDVIHLHNLHGYYLNVRILFEYLSRRGMPVVWTFHDCWPFTGHCSFFDSVSCSKWQNRCNHCPNTSGYPASWLIDNSRKNYDRKRELFNLPERMVLVSPSEWLAGHLRNSFLNRYGVRVINNGVNLTSFRPVSSEDVRVKYRIKDKYILGVANIWTARKGLTDFIKLRQMLQREIDILLVGLSSGQINTLPEGIIGIKRTEDTEEMAALYSGALVFVNPTYVDNFPAVNLEALACGTPVITYRTGGSPEAVDASTGLVIDKGDIAGLHKSIIDLQTSDPLSRQRCRARAEEKYSASNRYNDYLNLYEEILGSNSEGR